LKIIKNKFKTKDCGVPKCAGPVANAKLLLLLIRHWMYYKQRSCMARRN